MDRIQQSTLHRLCRELPAFDWQEPELAELVDPKLGVITGFQDFLDQMELLRRLDLGSTKPAGPIR